MHGLVAEADFGTFGMDMLVSERHFSNVFVGFEYEYALICWGVSMMVGEVMEACVDQKRWLLENGKDLE